MRSVFNLVCFAVTAFALSISNFPLGAQMPATPIPIVDVHNAYDGSTFAHQGIIDRMNRYGIGRMIVSPHVNANDNALVAFGQSHQDRLTIAVRTKTKEMNKGDASSIVAQSRRSEYGGMQEILIWHQAKSSEGGGQGAPAISMDIDSSTVRQLTDASRARNWPLIVHIEFAGGLSARARENLMEKFETHLKKNRDVNFGLMHRGQLGPQEISRLVASYTNVFFVMSHSTETDKYGFTSIFSPAGMDPEWRALMSAHTDRFVLSFDAAFGPMWEGHMQKEAAIWNRVLPSFPPAVAHKIAHENAERLWHLPPTLAIVAAGGGDGPIGSKGQPGPAQQSGAEGKKGKKGI